MSRSLLLRLLPPLGLGGTASLMGWNVVLAQWSDWRTVLSMHLEAPLPMLASPVLCSVLANEVQPVFAASLADCRDYFSLAASL